MKKVHETNLFYYGFFFPCLNALEEWPSWSNCKSLNQSEKLLSTIWVESQLNHHYLWKEWSIKLWPSTQQTECWEQLQYWSLATALVVKEALDHNQWWGGQVLDALAWGCNRLLPLMHQLSCLEWKTECSKIVWSMNQTMMVNFLQRHIIEIFLSIFSYFIPLLHGHY